MTVNCKCQTQCLKSIEKPVLFSGPMVRAIIQRKKKMTRRIVPWKILDKWDEYVAPNSNSMFTGLMPEAEFFMKYCRFQGPNEFYEGDILWVRETWCKEYYSQIVEPENHPSPLNENAYRYRYRASNDLPDGMSWRPSIFMPREACRLYLKVTGSRMEHLQDITEEDAIAEGVDKQGSVDFLGEMVEGFRGGFAALWDSLNSKRGHGWYKNPPVYVVEFELDEARSKLPAIAA
ncbi:hypothetical protein FACS189444_3080 [Spirochaetia bacterium]|nr:hypothetical protein FACS189444_3080 [Spirochaetia bacterium]